MVNNNVIFLHIQIEYLKCEFWEFESTQKDLWLIFNKCLKLAKLLPYYFYCMCSTINLRLPPIYLGRENSKLSRNIWFTKFGSVDYFLLNFEFHLCIKSKLKRKRLIWIYGLRRESKWASPVHPAQRAGGLTCGLRLSAALNQPRNGMLRWPSD